jgi:Clp amino terminal domain, pathogenicity island component
MPIRVCHPPEGVHLCLGPFYKIRNYRWLGIGKSHMTISGLHRSWRWHPIATARRNKYICSPNGKIDGKKTFMFERYTETTRRVIHWARYIAARVGSPTIETEHLLLGLLREDQSLARRFFGSPWAAEAVLKRVEEIKPPREKIPGSFEVPLSSESKRVLAFIADEADSFSNKSICTEHVLLGFLREKDCLAAKLLSESGVELASTREGLEREPHDLSSTESFTRKRGPLPEDVVESQTQLRAIKMRVNSAIADHDFSKAQYLSDEEAKESDKFYQLCRKYGLVDWIFG